MSKIFVVKNGRQYKYHNSEESFLKSINSNYTNQVVTIYDEVESHNALQYKNAIIEQRNRDYQLSYLLDGNEEYVILSEIRDKLLELEKDHRVYCIIRDLDCGGLTFSNFKKIISNVNYRHKILYSYKTEEWYYLLLKCHKFTTIKLSTWRYHNKIDQETIDNFNKAKERIKKERK